MAHEADLLLLDNDTVRQLRTKATAATTVRTQIQAAGDSYVRVSTLRACRSLMNADALNLREQDGTGFYFQLGDAMNEPQNALVLRNVLMDIAHVAPETNVRLFAAGKAALLNWSNTLPPKIDRMEELIECFGNN